MSAINQRSQRCGPRRSTKLGFYKNNRTFCIFFQLVLVNKWNFKSNFFHLFNASRKTFLWGWWGPRVNLSLRPCYKGCQPQKGLISLKFANSMYCRLNYNIVMIAVMEFKTNLAFEGLNFFYGVTSWLMALYESSR